ncbi:hypothetical protein QAD02_023281 [Eretmocerus hayati]|uniref:Uncharacterized protein n=1 Tax=Eretmocerus hayati TaxID=131215 RepID=A0ACC2PVK3_9HYME|nr:hypothetical protein QAD02_023281 [Eretmocerus hayati]
MKAAVQPLILLLTVLYQSITVLNGVPIYGPEMRIALGGNYKYAFTSLITNRSSTNFEEKYLCTSIMISDKHVITVAECLQNLPLSELEVTFGYTDRSKVEITDNSGSSSANVDDEFGMQVVPAKKTETFKEWSERKGKPINLPVYNDIAVIELQDYPGFMPALIPFTNYDQKIGSPVQMLAWGKVAIGNELLRQLQLPQKAPMKIMSRSACENKVDSISRSYTKFNLPNNVYCIIGSTPTVALHGDIGGPILDMSNNLVGMIVKRVPGSTFNWLDKSHVNPVLRLGGFQDFIEDTAQLKLGPVMKILGKVKINHA